MGTLQITHPSIYINLCMLHSETLIYETHILHFPTFNVFFFFVATVRAYVPNVLFSPILCYQFKGLPSFYI
jgi:hypothetical protein